MKYQTLFELRVQFADTTPAPCNFLDLRIPSEDAVLRRHRLLIRPRADGLDVVGPVGAKNVAHIPFSKLSIPFDIHIRDPEIALKGDLALFRKWKHPVFARPRTGGELQLKAGTAPLPLGVLARVELDGVESAWYKQPRRFFLSLRRRVVVWVYYVVCRQSGQLPTVTDPTDTIRFTVEPLTAKLVRNDPVGAALLARHPDRFLYRLWSPAPPLSATLSLRLGEQRLFAVLPAPSAQQTMSLVLPDSKPRDAFYRVLET